MIKLTERERILRTYSMKEIARLAHELGKY